MTKKFIKNAKASVVYLLCAVMLLSACAVLGACSSEPEVTYTRELIIDCIPDLSKRGDDSRRYEYCKYISADEESELIDLEYGVYSDLDWLRAYFVIYEHRGEKKWIGDHEVFQIFHGKYNTGSNYYYTVTDAGGERKQYRLAESIFFDFDNYKGSQFMLQQIVGEHNITFYAPEDLKYGFPEQKFNVKFLIREDTREDGIDFAFENPEACTKMITAEDGKFNHDVYYCKEQPVFNIDCRYDGWAIYGAKKVHIRKLDENYNRNDWDFLESRRKLENGIYLCHLYCDGRSRKWVDNEFVYKDFKALNYYCYLIIEK